MNLRAATYDDAAKALYVYFEPKGSKVAHTIPAPDGHRGVHWDLDKDFNVIGVEILNIDLKDITHGSR